MRNAIRYLYKYSFQKDAYRGTSLGPLLIAKRIPEDEARCGEDRPGCAPIMNPPKQPEERRVASCGAMQPSLAIRLWVVPHGPISTASRKDARVSIAQLVGMAPRMVLRW